MSKIPLYVDGDDVILQSSEVVVNILNQRYKPYPLKTVNEIKDWNYRSLFPKSTKKEVEKIFDSDEFWNNVEINPVFLEMSNQSWFSNHYIFYIFSQGTNINLEKKIEYFKKKSNLLPKYTFLGVPPDVKKEDILLEPESVQIDDNINNLFTNAIWKILLKNSHETIYNDITRCKRRLDSEAFYTADTMEDVCQILQFIPIMKQDELLQIKENQEFLKK